MLYVRFKVNIKGFKYISSWRKASEVKIKDFVCDCFPYIELEYKTRREAE